MIAASPHVVRAGGGTLILWAERSGRREASEPRRGGLRFAFCGTCGRRLESSWSNGHPAYRCRHGHTSATRPDPTRAKNAYVREDQITPHLAGLAILLARHEHAQGNPGQASQVTGPTQAAELIDYLRSSGHALTYDPQHRTLRADTEDAVAITVGRSH